MKNFAQNFWKPGWNPSEVPKAVDAMVGVVALRAAADADALFTTFSQQWERCKGTKVTIFDPNEPGGNEDAVVEILLITDIRVGDSLLTVSFQANSGKGPLAPIIETRTLGVRVNSIVESEVTYGRDPDNSTEAIARVMMEKLSDLS